MCRPSGLMVGERPWARRFLSERGEFSGGGSLNRRKTSGGSKRKEYCFLGATSTGSPIIIFPRRSKSGEKTRISTRIPCRITEDRYIVRRRHLTASGSRSS